MKDPARLIDSASGDALTLLDAGRAVAIPPPEALAQTLGQLGLSTATASAAAASSLSVLKALAVGMVAGAGASALVVSLQGPAPALAPPAALTQPPAAPTASYRPDQLVVPSSVPEAMPRATLPRTVPAPSSSASPSPALAVEIEQLDSARRALDSGDATTALEFLDEHEGNAARQLAPEGDLLRVRALTKLGRQDAAEALARRLLERYGTDAGYVARVRAATKRLGP